MNLIDVLVGRPLASHDEEEQRVGPLQGVPMLGLDGLASAAYGPEAAMTILIPLGLAGVGYAVPVIGVILAVLFLLYLSYRQTMGAYPNGGGSYTVASENLGERWGLLAAAALLLDYILVVAVGVSAGVGALVSAVPSLQPHMVALCLGILLFIAVVNLRGVRESGAAFFLPTYLFVATLFGVIGVGLFKMATSGGHPVAVAAPLALPASAGSASLWLLARAFASGCTAMTGVEAVSNGMGVFAQPRVPNAQRTLTLIVVILGALLAGIVVLCRAYGIGAAEPTAAAYQSVLSQLVAAVVGRRAFYYVTIGSVLAVLALSANTGFADFPRLCRLLAKDDFLPHAFAGRGRRLVYTRGIVVVTVVSGALLAGFGGITDNLIPLFAIGAFLAFTLSQIGMVAHWNRLGVRDFRLVLNVLGAAATAAALGVILVAKFAEGAWITLLLIPVVYLGFVGTRRHYEFVRRETECGRAIDATDLEPPVVVVPIKRWDLVSEKALRFALKLSPDVVALHVASDDGQGEGLREAWAERVEAPLRAAGRPVPRLVVAASEFRRLFRPIFRVMRALREAHPGRSVAVVIPELVEARWWQYLLHNQRATALKAALYLRGDRSTVVINVPWYLER